MPNDYQQTSPDLRPTVNLEKFRFWCQKVLPLVYDDSISYYEVLGKMVVYLNQVIDNVNADTENVITLKQAYDELVEYIGQVIHYDIHDLEEAVATAVHSAELAAADATNAQTYAQAANTQRGYAQTAAENANQSAINAIESAQNALTSETNARGYASSANQSALNASDSSLTAISMAQQATEKASDASDSATSAQNSASSAETDALKAEGLAIGQQNGVDVDSSSPYYHKNAKYYAEQAGQGAGAYPLSDLPDTNIVDPENGQILAYDATSEKWVNSDDVQGVTSLEALTDTAIAYPSAGQVLMYDATNSKWYNSAEKEVAISASAPSDPATKVWINETPQTPISLATTTDLAEVEADITTLSNNTSNALQAKENKATVIRQSAPTSITLANNNEYYLTNVGSLTIAFPTGDFECWIYIETASSFTAITLPNTAEYIGNAPSFQASEKWELSVKNGVIVSGKIG